MCNAAFHVSCLCIFQRPQAPVSPWLSVKNITYHIFCFILVYSGHKRPFPSEFCQQTWSSQKSYLYIMRWVGFLCLFLQIRETISHKNSSCSCRQFECIRPLWSAQGGGNLGFELHKGGEGDLDFLVAHNWGETLPGHLQLHKKVQGGGAPAH